MKNTVKRFIALLLVLCMVAPMALAADSYKVTVTISDGKSTLEYEYENMSGSSSLFEILMSVADEHKAELKSAFPGHGFSALAEEGVMAYISSDASRWTAFVNDYFGGNPQLLFRTCYRNYSLSDFI